MSDTGLEQLPVGADDIIAITNEVWSSFLDLELTAVSPEEAVLVAPVLTAVVTISGAWEGAVLLECPAAHAAAAAACMFSTPTTPPSDEEARDALGELANVVAGNVKSLLPAPSALSMPAVTSAGPPQRVAGATRCRHVAFAAPAGVLHVSIWKAS